MTEIQRYLAEEIAEDHADGLVSSQALRRLGLLGLGGAAAASLLAGPSWIGRKRPWAFQPAPQWQRSGVRRPTR